MKRLIIVGDSWASPPTSEFERPRYYTAQGHLVSRLADLGWQIENRAVRGGSNLDTWRVARRLSEPCPEWIVWLHTEIGRDWFREQKPEPWHLSSKIEQVSRTVYKEIQSYLDYLKPRKGLILIEGQSTRSQPWFSEYIQPRALIQDWRSFLCARDLPKSQIAGCLTSNENFLDLCLDSVSDQIGWINDAEFILDQMLAHGDLFPDQTHPGDIASADMALKLHRLMRDIDG